MVTELPTYDELDDFYGAKGENLGKINLPYAMKLSWRLNYNINRFSCNKKIIPNLEGIFNETLEHYGIEQIKKLGLDLFGGCYNLRKIRGGKKFSTHSWGIAIDLDPVNNKLRWDDTQASFAKPIYKPFWDICYKHNAVSLGIEKNYDWMHFQFCKI